MEAGMVSIVRLGHDYRFNRNQKMQEYEFVYKDDQSNERRDYFCYVVNAAGQPRSIKTDSSTLTRNLLKRKIVQVEEIRFYSENEPEHYKTGSVVVDPETHQVLLPEASGVQYSKPLLFAVGAMTRGQMIDTSMAHGLAKSTATVARFLCRQLMDTGGSNAGADN